MPLNADGRREIIAAQQTITDACRIDGPLRPLNIVLDTFRTRYLNLCESWPLGRGADIVFEMRVIHPLPPQQSAEEIADILRETGE